MNPLPAHVPIVIVGAGPVGMLLALQLQRQGQQVCLLEARAQGSPIKDRRTLALSYNSVQAFAAAGVRLPEHEVTAIERVHVSQQGGFGRTLLQHSDVNLPYLGQVVDYAVLMQACEAALTEQQVPVCWQAQVHTVASTRQFARITLHDTTGPQELTAHWLILAEGGHLTEQLPGIHRHSFDYQQSALITTLTFSQGQDGTAYERFAAAGPFALLPYHDAYRLVWTRTPEDAQNLQQASLADFRHEFQAAFGKRLGEITAMGDAAVFPLVLKQLNRVYSQRVICIGNAAQTMHPVAAQGLNLGVRDALALAECFSVSGSLNQADLGRQYGLKRSVDAHSIVGFTHSLVTVFDQPNAWLRLGRGVVMSALNTVPAWRRKLTEHLLFGL